MAYFDDPAHKAQWEKELAALREERQRRVNSAAKREVSAHENTVKLPAFEELVRQAAERHENKILRKSAEPSAAAPKNQPKAPAARGNIRERITFSQLLAEDEPRRSAAPTGSVKNRQITMEAGNAR